MSLHPEAPKPSSLQNLGVALYVWDSGEPAEKDPLLL